MERDTGAIIHIIKDIAAHSYVDYRNIALYGFSCGCTVARSLFLQRSEVFGTLVGCGLSSELYGVGGFSEKQFVLLESHSSVENMTDSRSAWECSRFYRA